MVFLSPSGFFSGDCFGNVVAVLVVVDFFPFSAGGAVFLVFVFLLFPSEVEERRGEERKEMVVIAGCKGQQQGLQPVCCLPFSSCDLEVAAARISSSSRRISYRGRRTRANVVVMSSLFRPCCSISVASPFEPRVNNSREGRRRISRLVCMVADTNADRRQQQKQQQQSPLQQQQQRELNPAVDEEKEQLTTQEEEEMSMIMTEDESEEFPSSTGAIAFASSVASAVGADAATAMTQRMKERKRERMAYLFAAVASSVGFVTLAAGAVYYRFIWQMEVHMFLAESAAVLVVFLVVEESAVLAQGSALLLVRRREISESDGFLSDDYNLLLVFQLIKTFFLCFIYAGQW